MLRDFRDKPINPNYNVLAIGNACLGLTLFDRAFIIFTYTPSTLEELNQLAGRGERSDINADIIGAMFTEDRIFSIHDLKLAVSGAECKQRFLRLDYSNSLNIM